jgi:hypothetical protein
VLSSPYFLFFARSHTQLCTSGTVGGLAPLFPAPIKLVMSFAALASTFLGSGTVALTGWKSGKAQPYVIVATQNFRIIFCEANSNVGCCQTGAPSTMRRRYPLIKRDSRSWAQRLTEQNGGQGSMKQH